MTVEENLSAFVTSARYEDLPREAAEGVKCLLMNSIAALVAGTGARGVKELVGLIRKWGGAPESGICGWLWPVTYHIISSELAVDRSFRGFLTRCLN